MGGPNLGLIYDVPQVHAVVCFLSIKLRAYELQYSKLATPMARERKKRSKRCTWLTVGLLCYLLGHTQKGELHLLTV
jgi:hypothetical protein